MEGSGLRRVRRRGVSVRDEVWQNAGLGAEPPLPRAAVIICLL